MKKVSVFLLAALFLIASCSDETTVFVEPESNLALETNEQLLTNSVVFDNSGVLDIIDPNGPASGTIARGVANEELAGDFPLTVVAQITPPSFSGGGENLTASHVNIDGDFAYVSYNTVNEVYAGGIDIIDIRNPNSPRVTSRLYFTNADLSALIYDDGFVYAVGGVDSETSTLATSNSFVVKIIAQNGRFNIRDGVQFGFQQGFVATDVTTTANTIMVTSGMDGSLTIYNKSTVEIETELPYADLRALTIRDESLALLDGSFGVHILDKNALTSTGGIPIDADFGIAKRTLALTNDKVVVSEGPDGAGVYNLNSGALLERIPIALNPEGVASEDIVTNAVASNEDLLLMANGGAGLCLSETQGAGLTDIVGILGLDGSVNYVASKGDYIFAASGRLGLQIIKLNRPSESLAQRCATLPTYNGSSNLNVNLGDELAFQGSKSFNNVNVNGSLLLCGSWTVRNNTNINGGGVFEMNGTYVVGRNNRRRNIVVNEGSTFRVEGNLTIFGNLVLNDGATIEFIGEDSVVNIFGQVNRSDSSQVLGTFDDVQDKF